MLIQASATRRASVGRPRAIWLLRHVKRRATRRKENPGGAGQPAPSSHGTGAIVYVAPDRHRKRLIANLPFDEWTEVFGSEHLTGALLDRLTHHVHNLEMNGESFRLKQSKTKNKT